MLDNEVVRHKIKMRKETQLQRPTTSTHLQCTPQANYQICSGQRFATNERPKINMGPNPYITCSWLPKAIVAAHPCAIVAVLDLASSWPSILRYIVVVHQMMIYVWKVMCKQFKGHVEDLLVPHITVEGSIN